jgi:hypothetical protein
MGKNFSDVGTVDTSQNPDLDTATESVNILFFWVCSSASWLLVRDTLPDIQSSNFAALSYF